MHRIRFFLEELHERLLIWWYSGFEFFQTSKVSRRLRFSVFFFILILITGSVGYSLLGGEETTLFDGFYMTVITVSTIGYSEVVNLENNIPGRLFTTFLAFTGIGLVTYMFSTLAALIIEGDLRHTFLKQKSERIIVHMEDHYIICGVGRVGIQVTEELSITDRDFSFGDINEERVLTLCEQNKGYYGLVGDCTDDQFLEKLGVRKAKGIFVCTDDDNTNLVVVLTAKQLNPKIRAVVMCKDHGYTRKLKSIGADRVISPFTIGGIRMADEMLRPDATNFMETMMHSNPQDLRFEQISVSSRLAGRKLSSLNIAELDNTLLIALRDKDHHWLINPKPDYHIQEHTVIIVLTSAEERRILEDKCNG